MPLCYSIVVCGALGLMSLGLAWADAPHRYQAFVGATLIDGTGRGPRRDATLLIENEHISAVGDKSEIAIPEDAKVHDVGGRWIVPGLIDAHMHFFQSGGLYTRPDVIDLRAVRPYAEEIAGIRERLSSTLARYLASGVTSVVDMGGPTWTFEVRELARRSMLAPRVVLAGPLISTTLPSALKSDDPPIAQVESPEGARLAVRRQSRRRPDFIKIWFIPAWSRPLSMEINWVAAVIEESHAQGLRVAVHATELAVARAAVEAGADILAHSVRDRRVDDAFVQLLKTRAVVYVTTLAVNEGYRKALQEQVDLTAFERRVGDPEVLATLDDLEALPPWKRWSQWLRIWPGPEFMFWNLKRLYARGISIAAGSDAGNIGTLHGSGLHRELELMAEAGLTPAEILTAATLGGARVMGRSAELGTLEPGKLADLLVLIADPLADIRNLRRIHSVVKGGRVFDPDAILDNR